MASRFSSGIGFWEVKVIDVWNKDHVSVSVDENCTRVSCCIIQYVLPFSWYFLLDLLVGWKFIQVVWEWYNQLLVQNTGMCPWLPGWNFCLLFQGRGRNICPRNTVPFLHTFVWCLGVVDVVVYWGKCVRNVLVFMPGSQVCMYGTHVFCGPIPNAFPNIVFLLNIEMWCSFHW